MELCQPDSDHERLVLQVTSLAPVRGNLQVSSDPHLRCVASHLITSPNQVSVLKEIAAQCRLETFQPVTVQQVQPHDVTLDYMELTFKDQFLSRADIWRFKVAVLGSCVYVGKHIAALGMRAQVEGLLTSNQDLFSGVVGNETKMIFRSRSARIVWLIQMSADMWEFAPDGELYYEKLLNRWLKKLIAKWSGGSVSHSVTIITFSRSVYEREQFPVDYDPRNEPFAYTTAIQQKPAGVHGSAFADGYDFGPAIHVDAQTGKYYEDFYKVVVMNYTGPDWSHLLTLLKQEFACYHDKHRWRAPEEDMPADYELCSWPREDVELTTTSEIDEKRKNPQYYVKWKSLPHGIPTRASEGNVLEAINVTLNILDKHYMDRDLRRTGQSIVMLTAGSGVFHTPQKLSQITKQRMMDNGVGMDLISLATPPMHVVPLFISPSTEAVGFKLNEDIISSTMTKELLAEALHAGNAKYQVPHWVNITFVDFDCKCTDARPTRSSSPLRQNHSNQLISHRMRVCQCQRKMNKQFQPLPASRMFDLTGYSSKMSFPEALKKIIQGYPRKIECSPTSRRLLSPQRTPSKINIKKARFKTPNLTQDRWQLAKTPDVELAFSPSVVAPYLGTSLLARETLRNYDDEVFQPVAKGKTKNTTTPSRDLLFSPSDSKCDITSVTFSGPIVHYDSGPDHLLRRWNSASFHEPKKAATRNSEGYHGGSTSMLSSILSPRDEMNIIVEQAKATGIAQRAKANSIELSESIPLDENEQSFWTRLSTKRRIRSFSQETEAKKTQSGPRQNASEPPSASSQGLRSSPVPISSPSASSSSSTCPLSTPKYIYGKSFDSARHIIGMGRDPKCPPKHPGQTSAGKSGPDPKKGGSGFQPLARAMTMNKANPGYYKDLLMRSPPLSNGGTLRRTFTAATKDDLGKSPVLCRNVSAESTLAKGRATTTNGEAAIYAFSSINPFKYSTDTLESACLKLTSDRRRWSHIFPVIPSYHQPQLDSIAFEDVPSCSKPLHLGPNWKSLTSPAILPLTTDYFPSPKDLHTCYNESFYTLTLPSITAEMVPKYTSHEELLIEMVCQRLANDFQLLSFGRENKPLADVAESVVSTPANPRGKSPTITTKMRYRLSMGHRIHQLIYDPELQTIEVKKYSRHDTTPLPCGTGGTDPRSASVHQYTYSLWVELTQSFHALQQSFHEFPKPEANWNSLDHLLCGYIDQMSDMMKFRRIRFAIMPPSSTAPGFDAREYVDKVQRFLSYIQTRIADPKNNKVTVEITKSTVEPSSRRPVRWQGYKIACRSNQRSKNSEYNDARKEWVMLEMEDRMEPFTRNFHLDVRWLACSGVIAEEFVSTLKRKSKQASLELRRVPEYSCVSFVQIHPLIAPIFLPVSSNGGDSTTYNHSIITALVGELDFILDDERVVDGANGMAYGLDVDRSDSARDKPTSPSRRMKGSHVPPPRFQRARKCRYEQYMHRRMPVFLRVIPHGLLWIPGYDYEEPRDGKRVDALFLQVCQLTMTGSCSIEAA